MSAKSKKYLITTKTREIYILRKSQKHSVRGYCLECEAEVELETLDAITTQTGKSTRELFELIEGKSLHSVEIASGHLLICQNSLAASEAKRLISNKEEEKL